MKELPEFPRPSQPWFAVDENYQLFPIGDCHNHAEAHHIAYSVLGGPELHVIDAITAGDWFKVMKSAFEASDDLYRQEITRFRYELAQATGKAICEIKGCNEEARHLQFQNNVCDGCFQGPYPYSQNKSTIGGADYSGSYQERPEIDFDTVKENREREDT